MHGSILYQKGAQSAKPNLFDQVRDPMRLDTAPSRSKANRLYKHHVHSCSSITLPIERGLAKNRSTSSL
jgi:hypothetical protein